MPNYEHEKDVLRRDAFPIPQVQYPVGRRCIQIDIPDDIEWEQQFFSVLTLLTKWNSFEKEPTRSARFIAAQWRDTIWHHMKHCDGTPMLSVQDMENEMTVCEILRFHNGKLQGLCCGVWSDITGQGEITDFAHPGQQGGDAPQPQPGGSVCYHFAQQASFQYLLPTVVNAGDVLTFSNLGGAATDGFAGALSRWDCPDGKWFFAGSCQDGTELVLGSPDPMPTAAHMSLVVQIAGTWYSALTPITVPGGVSNAQVVIQLNDNIIGDNQGSFSGDCCVQNNAVATFEHVFNFQLTNGGWVVGSNVGDAGLWVPGTGWEAADPATSNPRGLAITLTFPSTVVITYMECRFANITIGNDPVPSLRNGYIGCQLSGTTVLFSGNTPLTAGEGSRSVTGHQNANLAFIAFQLSSGIPYNTGHLDVPEIILRGEGIDPFI